MHSNRRKYELVVMLKPNLPDNVKFGVESKIIQIIESNGGSLIGSQVLGRRHLEYPIKATNVKYNEGLFILYNFDAGSEGLINLRKSLKSNENVLRFLLVKKES